MKKLLENNYNLTDVVIIKNIESTDGNVYNINAKQGKYILKVYNDELHSRVMGNLLDELNKKNFYVPHVLENKGKKKYTKVNNKFYMIYSFLEGEPLKKLTPISSDISIKLADELRRFHDECTNLDNIKLKRINFFESNLRKSILHFDLTKGNIFYNKNTEKIGFIDFDDAKYGETIIDIAILIANLYFSKTKQTNFDGIKIFLNEYYKNDDELKKTEIRLIKSAAEKWIDYVLNRNIFESSTTESFKVKKEKIEEFNFEQFI